jgi:hypothetical protein
MVIRFVVPQTDPDSHKRVGVFWAAYRILDDVEADDGLRISVNETLDWFRANLAIPKPINRRAILWFKKDARECMRRMWHLVADVKLHGFLVSQIRSRKAGYVVYEDALQIAAIPFRDTRT